MGSDAVYARRIFETVPFGILLFLQTDLAVQTHGMVEAEMTRPEAIKLLALIKVAYPTAYRDMDDDSLNATVSMWESTFPSTPYVIMEMAFDRHRRKSKFPPTVAEMIDELEGIYYDATEDALANAFFGRNPRLVAQCRWVADQTSQFTRRRAGGINYSVVTNKMLTNSRYKQIGDGSDG